MKKGFYISFIISLMVFSLIFIGFDQGLFLKYLGIPRVEDDEELANDEEVEELPKVKDEMIFLMLGVDSNDLDEHSNIRTDTMILTKVNFNTGQVDILSIPRDTRTEVRGKLDKINHAHSYGGIDLTLKTVSDFLDIDLDYYVKLNYDAVEEVVDKIGGVEIDVPKRMVYEDRSADPPLYIDLEPGLQTLDGDKSLQYLRFRSYEDGDIGRVGAQQIFIKEFVSQTFSLRNIFKIPSIIKTYYDYIDTNIPMSTILKGATFKKDDVIENLKTDTIPGEARNIDGVSYYIHYEEETEELVEDIFGDYRR